MLDFAKMNADLKAYNESPDGQAYLAARYAESVKSAAYRVKCDRQSDPSSWTDAELDGWARHEGVKLSDLLAAIAEPLKIVDDESRAALKAELSRRHDEGTDRLGYLASEIAREWIVAGYHPKQVRDAVDAVSEEIREDPSYRPSWL